MAKKVHPQTKSWLRLCDTLITIWAVNKALLYRRGTIMLSQEVIQPSGGGGRMSGEKSSNQTASVWVSAADADDDDDANHAIDTLLSRCVV